MKFHKTNLWIIFALLIGCSNVSTSEKVPAQPPVTPSNFPTAAEEFIQSPCEQTAVTQNELNLCAAERANLSHTKLVSLIDEINSQLDEIRREKLIEIETDWENMIVRHCEWQSSFFEGGSVQPMWFSECLNQQYLDRIETLRLDLCEGHGMTGECEESLKYKSNVP